MGKAKVVSIINWKGGVGKTTLTHHLATGLQEMKLGEGQEIKVLLIDADAQCNLSIACLKDDNYENVVIQAKKGTLF